MKNPHVTLAALLVLAGTVCFPTESRAQADPTWLNIWNEAVAKRPSTIVSTSRIAPEGEPGDPLTIRGKVVAPDGTPAGGVIVHAYHRDSDGLYFGPNDNPLTTWRLQGWVLTDSKGRFEYRTIRPAQNLPGGEGAHIHVTLESDTFGRQWAPKILFADDPLVSADERRKSKEAGKYGGVREVAIRDGIQTIDVRIKLKESADF